MSTKAYVSEAKVGEGKVKLFYITGQSIEFEEKIKIG